MEAFLRLLKARCSQLENNTNPTGALLQVCFPRRAVQCYDPELYPCWKRFATAIENYEGVISHLDFRRIHLSEDILNMLTSAFKKNKKQQLITLSFYNNDFGEQGIRFVTEMLTEHQSLKSLVLSENKIVDMETAEELSGAIVQRKSLQTLLMPGCDVGVHPEILSSIVSAARNVKHVGFYRNLIDLRGATVIANCLASNPCIEKLDLEDNEINDDGAACLAQALRSNDNLKYLLLGLYNLTFVGIRALCDAIFDKSSLNAVMESNHTVTIPGSRFSFYYILTMNKNRNAAQNRKAKIFQALHDGRTQRLILQHFNDMPVELMPNVLELLQKDPTEERHLSNLFEILKSWKMPLLFLGRINASGTKRKRSNIDHNQSSPAKSVVNQRKIY